MRYRFMAGVLFAGGMVVASAQEASAPPIVGAWTLNRSLSDTPQDEASDDRDAGERGRGRRRGDGAGGGLGRGGRGGAGGGRGRGGGQGSGGGQRGGADPQEIARLRAAMRDIVNPPDHFTIVQAGTMVIITGPDGRTTRLSPDGKKIADESTKTDRRTKWDNGKLVSEIGGLPGGKIMETYSVDPERRQLHITVQRDDERRPLRVNRVYDRDER